MSDLFDPLHAAGPVRDQVADVAWVRAMLDAEAALAGALADAGMIPVEHAEAIATQCRAEYYVMADLGSAATGIGNPVGPLVRALTERVGGDAAGSVHQGATSQDIVDTATMLVARRAFDAVLPELDDCAGRLAALAAEHTGTLMAGRTLLQHALPTTFGFVAAGWLSAVDNAHDRLTEARDHRLACQLGGAVGTLASLGERGPAVVTAYANRLGLREPTVPWHTDRSRIVDLAFALAHGCAAVGKIARDLSLLAQTEIGEITEDGEAGGSSTLPHKRNPIAAINASAAAAQAPGLVATLLAATTHEHQRAAGSWHAEWRPLIELLRATGSAVHWLRAGLHRIHIHPERMRANLDTTGGLLLAERVTTALTPEAGRLAAHDAVTTCARRATEGKGTFLDLLAADPVVGKYLSHDQIAVLLDPTGYLGSVHSFVNRALEAHRRHHS